MTHMVSFYPDRDRSMAVAEGLIAGGATYLEVQFPFSDPTADGPVIQAACQHALEAGFTVGQGLSFVSELRNRFDTPIFIMTYASLIFARGVRDFLTAGRDAGAAGFILPDLPLDYDEGAYEIGDEIGTTVMPVTVTSMNEDRFRLLEQHHPAYLYVALRRGITGDRTDLSGEHLGFLDRLRTLETKVFAGFGISERAQVKVLDPHVHAAVVGSALVRSVTHAVTRTAKLSPAQSGDEIRKVLTAQVRELAGETD
jgi:tryptophan synthase alpha chain